MKTQFELPVLNLRDVVMFPKGQQQLYIGRDFSIAAIQRANRFHRGKLVVVTQKDAMKLKPFAKQDSYSVGTLCKIEKSMLTTDGDMKLMLEGEAAVKIQSMRNRDGVRYVFVKPVAKKKGKLKLGFEQKLPVLRYLMKWRPDLALNEDDSMLQLLKKETDPVKFVASIVEIICRSESRESVSALKKRQIGVGRFENSTAMERKRVEFRIGKCQKILSESDAKLQLLKLEAALLKILGKEKV